VDIYGKTVHALRGLTQASMNREPEWRGPPWATASEEEKTL